MFFVFLFRIFLECVIFAGIYRKTAIMEEVMRWAIISIGSNVPDKEKRVSGMCGELKHIFPACEVSAVYTTPAVGRCAGMPDYCNAVARIATTDDYDALKAFFKQKEVEHGRSHDANVPSLVPLDIDIVVWEGKVLRPRDMEQEYMRVGLRQLGLI